MDAESLEKKMMKAASIMKAKIVKSVFPQHNPHGLFGSIVIAESHFAIHTWPNQGCAAIDLFTCGPLQTNDSLDFLRSSFSAERLDTIKVPRGMGKSIYQFRNKLLSTMLESSLSGKKNVDLSTDEIFDNDKNHDLVKNVSPGIQVLGEMSNCSNLPCNPDLLEKQMRSAAKRMHAKVVDSAFHKFKPHGLSGSVITNSSHFAIHTWPEHKCAAIDLLTSQKEGIDDSLDYLRSIFDAEHLDVIRIPRGMGRGISRLKNRLLVTMQNSTSQERN